MKMYVKPSIEVIELQLNDNIAAVPTTVYKGSTKEEIKRSATEAKSIALKAASTGLNQELIKTYQISL